MILDSKYGSDVCLINIRMKKQYLLFNNRFQKDQIYSKMPSVQNLLPKLKILITDTPFPQIFLFVLAKICTGLMELPHQKKQLTYIPFLICTIVFLGGCIGLKIFRHKLAIVQKLLSIQAQCFLLWIITTIMMVFSWSLLDSLEWGLLEIIMVILCQFLSIFMLTLMTSEKFITKMQFIAYEIILCIEIFAVSIKTVGFIKHNTDSPHKDLVLLNLTTQIALMIILMDALEKSYRRMKSTEIKDEMTRFENEMVFTNKVVEMTNHGATNLRDNFQIKE